ncbi:uncharacterized protein [Montipora foliosa]|uniref:uncharacterized protein n=1 Tax=Montipora foliosa TaxID=591990 RepID=UPI0035F1D6B8
MSPRISEQNRWHTGTCWKSAQCGFSRVDKWFEHQPETVLENNDYKLLWDYNIQTDHQMSARRPDVINKQEQTCQVIDIAVPEDTAVKAKEEEKLEKYQDLAREIQKMWSVRTQVLPVVIGALGTAPKRLESNLKCIGNNTSIELIQKPLSLAQQEF